MWVIPPARVPVAPRAALLLAALIAPVAAMAEDGLWTFDNPPLQRFREQYAFSLAAEWLDKVRSASVRFKNGSGAFVSADGLVITNHHVGLGCIQSLSTPQHDYVASGFLASSREEELACPGDEIDVLTAIEDVTPRVLGTVTPQMSDKAAAETRRAASARVQAECAGHTGLSCEVVALYGGALYHLYVYKRYTDVRLVFTPERQAAFFGGNTDNFAYPSHSLDVAFFRAYEGGRPAHPAAFLPWSASGAAEGELVFISGHPGSTARLKTLAEVESERDVVLPASLHAIGRRLAVLTDYSARGAEMTRRAEAQVFLLENSKKAQEGRLSALRNPQALARRIAEEIALRERVIAGADLSRAVGDPWSTIAAARRKADARLAELRLVGFGGSHLLELAGMIVRHAAETRKPSEARLAEFRDANLASLESQIQSAAPVYEDLEEVTLADQFQYALEELGREHPFVKAALEGRSPVDVARGVVSGTRLKDVSIRKGLMKGGTAAVERSKDPMIALALRIDPVAREIRKWREDEVDAVMTRARERLAEARWRVFGKSLAPDATSSLRLSYGTVKGYTAEGTTVAPYTTFYGLYDRSAAFGSRAPWDLPPRYVARREAVDLATPLNFVSTADSTAGHSGSPVINRRGELVGIVFDGNIQSLALNYFYTDEQARTISVDSRGIIEALRKIYVAEPVLRELRPESR